MAKNKDAAHDEHRPDVGLYIKIFGALMVLTVVTVVISKFHLPRPQAIGLGLFVAAIKASLVGAIFMHLWGENKLIHKVLYVTVAGGAILLIPLMDCLLLSRSITTPIAVASQHPGGHEAAAGHVETVTETVKPDTPAKPAKKAAKGH